MTKIILTIAEFVNFRALADAFGFHYEHKIKHGKAEVNAKTEDLTELGYFN